MRKTTLSALIIVCALSLAAYFYFRETPKEELKKHNECIIKCRADVRQIDLAIKQQGPSDRTIHKTVAISDPAELQLILSCLEIRNLRQHLGDSHLCYGNISIVIKAASGDHSISYDHGCGIYPTGKDVGFIMLDSASCKKLNSYLLSKGFTKGQIGYR